MFHANALGSMQKLTIHALPEVCMDPWLYFDAWIHAVLAWIHAVSHGLCYFQIHTRLHGLMVSAESCVAYARAWIHAFSHGLRDPGYRDALHPRGCGPRIFVLGNGLCRYLTYK